MMKNTNERRYVSSQTRLIIAAALLFSFTSANAEEFGQGPRRNLLNVVTSDLPNGKAQIAGGERIIRSGGRSPWHTAGGPKFLYVISGLLTVQGLNGKTLLSCGPGPKLCLSTHKELFFFANTGSTPVKFLVIGMDPVGALTKHEQIGQVTQIVNNDVTIALGNLKTSGLVMPRKEIVIRVRSLDPLAIGDNVVTNRYNPKDHTANSVSRLSKEWR